MAALPHASGSYRAYKKINGMELQKYFPTLKRAKLCQAKWDKMSALKPTKVFSKTGRLNGFRISLSSRYLNRPVISMSMQLKKEGVAIRRQFKYKGEFEIFWKKTLALWKETHKLTDLDMVGYMGELQEAKILYIRDLGALESKH